jgi:dGTPase
MIDFKLAAFAVNEEKSRGRLHQENYDDAKYRSVFGRDRDRIINSSAFRRLQYKTQVFVNHEGDHYRTRLTHSLEVAQIARWIAGALKVNKDLAEIVSLAHDLGHTPFGHAGEDALNQKMQGFGGFSHNAHTLKIITSLETRFIEFEGLNLSWEILEGVVKHNGPVTNFLHLNSYVKEYNQRHGLDLKKFPSIEAQISAISDDIAYNNHDIEDGLRANLFSVEELLELPLIGKIYRKILKKYPNIKRELLVGETKKLLTLEMVKDVIITGQENLLRNKISSEKEVRNAKKILVHFSSEMEMTHQALKKFLMLNMYRHPFVNRMTANAKKIVSALFDFYMKHPNSMPYEGEAAVKFSGEADLAILVSDYIAGMTDRYAIKKFEELIYTKSHL